MNNVFIYCIDLYMVMTKLKDDNAYASKMKELLAISKEADKLYLASVKIINIFAHASVTERAIILMRARHRASDMARANIETHVSSCAKIVKSIQAH